MKIKNEFSQNAKTYDDFNIIQTKIVEELINSMSQQPKSILDIGCGSGGLYRSVSWPLEHFVGVDFAEGMLELHPRAKNVELFARDFNSKECCKNFEQYNFDRIISASALQWASDLDKTLQNIADLNVPVSFAIFTSGTFKTLYEIASIPPLLRTAKEVRTLCEKHFNAEYEIKKYTLKFSSVREMFQYMKKSGVGAARNILNYKQMKALMNNYPFDYLEFEVLIISQESQ